MQTTSGPELNLNSCDREPIHLIANIQDVGFLVSFQTSDLKVQNVSENIGRFLGIPFQLAIGKPLGEILAPNWVQKVVPALAARKLASLPTHLEPMHLSDGSVWDCYYFESEGLGVLEFEKQIIFKEQSQMLEDINSMIAAIQKATHLRAAAQELARGVRSLTDLDRVMIYHFLPKVWDGEVIAEDRIASSHSFLNHRFPASDIPKPARDLYLRNQVRFIHDATLPVSPLYPKQNSLTGRVFDLQDSRLRAVAPVHLEYLKNMGVTSSFSVSIVVEGELWGLITCHHLSPLEIPARIRSACEILANTFAVRAAAEEKMQAAAGQLQFEKGLRSLILNLREKPDLFREFLKEHNNIRQLFRANGIAFISQGEIDVAGITPPLSVLKEMLPVIEKEMSAGNKSYFATTSLLKLKSDWEFFKSEVSGLLAVKVSSHFPSYFLIFRSEVIQTINWGGDPRKTLEKRNYQGPINPRASFESWQEKIYGLSLDWNDYEIEGAMYLKSLAFETFALTQKLAQELSEKKGQK